MAAIARCLPSHGDRFEVLHAVVFVLTEEFVQSKAPMLELHLALQRYHQSGKSTALLPVFLSVSKEDCANLEQLYGRKGWSKPDADTLKQRTADLKEVAGMTGVRLGQVFPQR